MILLLRTRTLINHFNYSVGSTGPDKQTLEKQFRLNEVLKGITQLFKRLHLCYERAQDQTSGMEYTQVPNLPIQKPSLYLHVPVLRNHTKSWTCI